VAGPATKYSFSGLGDASATIVLGLLAANPSTTWLATGFVGKVVNVLLSYAFSMAASVGLVLLNVGAERVETMIDQHAFDGSFDSAEKLLEAARQTGHVLTPAEIAAIDGPVIDAFRKFGSFARQKP
jgi:hypothetical protein